MKWISIREEHLLQILDWRTSEAVTRFMYTDIDYSLDNQKKWFASIQADDNGRYWLIENRGELVGFISITDIDWRHKRGSWNFYIGNPKYAMIAGLLGAYMYNYAFYTLNFEKLSGEVMDVNKGVRALHQKLGAREVGVLEHHILKHEIWHDVHVFEMTKVRWQKVGQKFRKYVPEMEV